MAGAPCDWPIDTTCCPDWDDVDPAIQTQATAWSSFILWALSGRQFAPCPITVRPCGRCVEQTYQTYGVWTDGYQGAVGPMWLPYIGVDGNWRNCGCTGGCRCAPTSQVWLPGPVDSIVEVRVDNVVVAPAEYRVDIANDGKFWLVGQQGRIWPECQNFDQPEAGVDNTFVVTYNRGRAVPPGGDAANGRLACEYAKLCAGAVCALSAEATTISRDGVTYSILSPEDIIAKGFTPITAVNQWIWAVNPNGLKSGPRVWSPDSDIPRVTV